jgi:hypothetical protein
MPKLFDIAGVRMLIALVVALLWGAVCGLIHAPFSAVAAGGLTAAALAMWLERAALTRPVRGRTADVRLLLVAAYGFLAIIGIGLVSAADLAVGWLRR